METVAPATPLDTQARTPVLDPVSRATEILFGLIMVLTFTASLNAAEAGRADVRLMLIGALGCNLAWGLIDAAMYLISARAEKAISRQALQAVRSAKSPALARRAIAGLLPPLIADAIGHDGLERVRIRLLAVAPVTDRPHLEPGDIAAAAAVFLLVFTATLPVVLPFIVVEDPRRALLLSHGIAIASLFLAGHSLGRHWGKPWQVGLTMVALGILLVAIAVALGG